MSKSEVGRIRADLDSGMAAFRDRSLSAQQFPYVFLNAANRKVRVNHGWSPRSWWS